MANNVTGFVRGFVNRKYRVLSEKYGKPERRCNDAQVEHWLQLFHEQTERKPQWILDDEFKAEFEEWWGC